LAESHHHCPTPRTSSLRATGLGKKPASANRYVDRLEVVDESETNIEGFDAHHRGIARGEPPFAQDSNLLESHRWLEPLVLECPARHHDVVHLRKRGSLARKQPTD
jgi:hypothetical protein